MKTSMRTRSSMVGIALSGLVMGSAIAADVNLTDSAVGFNQPIGIDFHEPTGKLIMSVNYDQGLPNNLDLVDPVTGTASQFSTLIGLLNELKVATVRATGCQGGFAVGEVFTGNGTAGGVIRIGPTGTPVQNPWVVLPGPGTDLVRGSLFQDRFCAANGDLIVVTGNEQTDPPINVSTGNVWRVSATATANCSSGCTLVGTTNTHLEGVTTVPNLPLVYGPLAGRILAGAEDLISAPFGSSVGYGTHGRIYAFNPNGVNDFFTIGAGTGGACNAQGQPSGCNFATVEIHPEDLDVIRRDSVFFGVNYENFPDGRMLTAPTSDFAARCGQILITREFPSSTGGPGNPSGLSALRWDSAAGTPVVDYLTSNINIRQWEHVTFTSGQDCATTITIAKTPDNGTFTVGQQITWTIVVRNTGTITATGVQVTDPLPTTGGLTWGTTTTTAGTCSVSANTLSCMLGDLAPGASATVTVTSNNVGGAPAAACTGNKINNTATATATNAPTVSDPGDTTCTPNPGVTIVKFTNGADANDPNAAGVPNIAPNGTVTWTYKVTNTGQTSIPRANVNVTDNVTGVTPIFQMELSGNGDTVFDPGEMWQYVANGTALNLTLPGPSGTHLVPNSCTAGGTQPPRTAYTNIGTVTVPGATASDPSSYCNPPNPAVTIIKFTNGADANDPNAAGVPNIAPNGTVTWTYRVTNTGNVSVPRAQVVVTDNVTGVTPTFTSEITGNGNTVFDPGEVWLYTATGTALNLTQPGPAGTHLVPNSCTAGGTQPPRTAYTNIGTVTIPGATASDPSSYCNPSGPNVTIIKFTNGSDANDPNAAGVPNIPAGGTVTWTYRVTNTGNTSIPRAQVVVTDNTTGVTPTFTSEITGNGDTSFDPGEVWLYTATGTALNLVLPPPAGTHTVANSCTAGGTQPPRTAYTNIGTVTIPGASATDPSSYCNPPNPAVTIIKFTNGVDANDPNAAGVPNIAPNGTVTWTYRVTNTGNTSIPRANVVVTDNTTGVTPTFTSEITGNGDTTFNPGEVWLYTATGTAVNLTLPPPGVHTVPNSCTAGGTQPPRTAYTNIGTVTIPGASATDPSSYCNPPGPNVTIVKFTNGADANDPNGAGVPNVAPGGTVTWTYRVTNTGNVSVPRAQVLVVDNVTGVTPTFTSEITGNGDTSFDPGEVWLYTATGTALNLTLPGPSGTHLVPNSCTANGTQLPRTAYTNIGTVTIPGATASDPSSYCNPPGPNVTIIKFTNGADANDPNAAGVPNIPVGGTVTWTYRVTNTGNVSVPRAQVSVTDNTTGVTPTFTSEISGNGDTVFDPGEVWLYTATGTSLDLTLPPPAGVHTVANSCTAGGTQPPRTAYTNVGTVTIPGATANDPSSYCNPPPVTGKSIEIGPSSMEGSIKIDIGDWVNGGYSFKTNFTGTITITATVSITGKCTGGTLAFDTLVVPLGTRTYSAVNGADWLPTGDANSVLSWQGSLIAPATLCGGGQLNASKGAVFDATISGVPAGKAVTFRFKYRDPAAKNKPNTNCLDTSDPNRNRADVCGASWSETKHDP